MLRINSPTKASKKHAVSTLKTVEPEAKSSSADEVDMATTGQKRLGMGRLGGGYANKKFKPMKPS
jgi:hypothetical protein